VHGTAPASAVKQVMAGRRSVDLFFGPVLDALGVPSDEQISWRQARERVLSEDRARREPPSRSRTFTDPVEMLG
jgi:hypothetical protein